MTFYSGQNGRLQIDGTTAAKVTNWSISSSMSPLSTTTLEDTDQTFVNGLRTTTGSCRLFYYDAGTTNSCSTLIRKLMKAQSSGGDPGQAAEAENVTFNLQVVDGDEVKQITVEALLTSVSMSMAVGEVLSADVAFQVNGAIDAIGL